MTLWRNTRSCHADLIEYLFDVWIDVSSRAGQESVSHSVFENASIGNHWDRQPGHLAQRFRRPEGGRKPFSGLGQELLPLLEPLANRHVTQNNGKNDVIAVMDLGDCGFSRKLCSAFS